MLSLEHGTRTQANFLEKEETPYKTSAQIRGPKHWHETRTGMASQHCTEGILKRSLMLTGCEAWKGHASGTQAKQEEEQR
eukprot:2073199-Pleurochrysis_carterae.AAC.1